MNKFTKFFAKAKRVAKSDTVKKVAKVAFKAFVRFAVKQFFDAAFDGMFDGLFSDTDPSENISQRRTKRRWRIQNAYTGAPQGAFA